MLKCFLSVVVVGGWSSGGFVGQEKEKRETKKLYNIIENMAHQAVEFRISGSR